MRQKVRTEAAGGIAYECAAAGDRIEDAVDPQPGVGDRQGSACALAQSPHAAKGESW